MEYYNIYLYIELEKVNPEYFGVSVMTVDGQTFNYGDYDVDFSIQSCSKPLMYCLAAEEIGSDEVFYSMLFYSTNIL